MRGITAILIVFSVFSCNQKIEKVEEGEKVGEEFAIRGYAQGTTYSIKYIQENRVNYQKQIDSLLQAIDNSMSTWVDSSIISQVNEGPAGAYKVDSMFANVFKLSKSISEETNGSFNATTAPLIHEWGIGFSNPKKISQYEVDSLLRYTGYNKFKLEGSTLQKLIPEASLDFNGIAQGYSVDVLTDFMESKDIENFMIELGGEVAAKGRNANGDIWRIGIDKPKDKNMDRELNAIISLQNKALATSGNYRKFYEVDGERFSHTIDPESGFPVKHNLLSATVIAKSCGEADAYATALMVMGLENGKEFLYQHPELEAYLIYAKENGKFGNFMTDNLKEDIQILE